ncbi:MAG: hypothetical protein ACRCWW_08280 [Scandinavium sp.]|uniref:hypothetical protein n=1 Tax=Scandinavium sp. TaxID=2830653 RepID=UPI003F3E20E9
MLSSSIYPAAGTASAINAHYAALITRSNAGKAVLPDEWRDVASAALHLLKEQSIATAAAGVLSGESALVAYQEEIAQQHVYRAQAVSSNQFRNGLPPEGFECQRFGKHIYGKKTGYLGIHVIVTKSNAPSVPAGTYLRLFDSGKIHRGSLRWYSEFDTLTIRLESGLKTEIKEGKALYNKQHFLVTHVKEGGKLPVSIVMEKLAAMEAKKHG